MLLLTIALNLEMLLGLGLALLVEKATRGQRMLRTLMMFPMMFSPILVGFQFKFLFNDNVGLVNNALQSLGITSRRIPWLIDGTLAFFAIVVAEVWSSTPVFAILILAGLLAMPRSRSRRRKVDGCTPWQSFRYVTWPFIMPFAYIAMTIRSLDVGRAYDIVKIMTDGGPARTHRADLDAGRPHRPTATRAWAWPTPWPTSRSCSRSSSPSTSSESSRPRGRRSRRTGDVALTRNQTSHLVRMGAERRSLGRPVPRHAGHLRCPAPGSCSTRLRPTVEIMAKPPVWIPQKLSLDAYTRDVRRLGTGRRPGPRLFPQFADHLDHLDRDRHRHRHGRRLRLRPLPLQGKSALFLGLMLTRTVPGIALSLPLFIILRASASSTRISG